MPTVAILTIFKDEAHILYEWCKYNLSLGFDHIYMINNNSNDKYTNILKDLDSDKITIFSDTRINQQLVILKDFYRKIKKKYDWIFITDLDEFLYFNDNKNSLKEFLDDHDENISCIKIQWTIFIPQQFKQPKSVIDNNCMIIKPSLKDNNFKNFYRTNIPASKIRIHKLRHKEFKVETYYSDNNIVQINHYTYQSLEFLLGIKYLRGGGNDTDPSGSKWITFYNNNNILNFKYKNIKVKNNNILKKKNKDFIREIMKRPQTLPDVKLYNNPVYYKIKEYLKMEKKINNKYSKKKPLIKFYKKICDFIIKENEKLGDNQDKENQIERDEILNNDI